MSNGYWGQLILLTLTNPAEAARQLIALRLSRDVLWTGLLLAAVLNTLIFSLSELLMAAPVPGVLGAPLVYFVMVAGGLALTIVSLYWAGRILGGSGRFEDLLVVILWLQVLRVMVQLATLLLSLLVPPLAMLAVFAAMLLGLYIMVHFVDQAHRLGSVARAAGVLALSVLLMAVALYLLFAVLGSLFMGGSSYV
ncbi:MAG: Yip1 family protein [Pseudodonghicola sp.]